MGSNKIINLCNSKIGFEGNIGKRTGYILDQLESRNNLIGYSISRAISDKKIKKAYTYGIFKNVPSLLNYFRVHFVKSFNHKYYDIKLFEFFVLYYLKFISLKQGDVIHIWELSPRIIKFLKKKGVKIILDVPIAPHKYRDQIKDVLLTKFTQEQDNQIIESEQFCFDNVDVIIAPSLFVKDEVIKYNIDPNKIRIVPFGVSVDTIQKSYNSEKKGVDYCLAGHLNKRKGVQYLLEIWDTGLFKEDRLHLCGRMTPGIKKQIQSMKHNDNIILPGFINTGEYFKNCDVYVFPSLMEGSSKSVYEAMNRSMPVICTLESGSIVRDGEEGYIIEKMNTQQIQEKMLLFKNDKKLLETMGKKAKNRVSNFTWERYASSLIEVYEEE